MARSFNVTGSCDPQLHYMVDIENNLEEIKDLIDSGAYFTINRARQFGKTTTLKALTKYLKADYIVIPLDFQKISNFQFADEHIFSVTFAGYMLRRIKNRRDPVCGLDEEILRRLDTEPKINPVFALLDLFNILNDMCDSAEKPIVMIINEVDSATNNQVFLDFLAQLRSDYLDRRITSTFQSVILAGVYDVKNIKRKIRSEDEHKVNSPWNIATDFLVNMSFSKNSIAGMLKEYENDYQTGMDTDSIAGMIYDYTSGYPFLVSRFCKLIDERVAGSEEYPDKTSAWTKGGFLEAEKILLAENNTLFESLTNKLTDYPELKNILSAILFGGKDIPYVATNYAIEMAAMFGFIRNKHNTVAVSNRIFETVLYNHLLSEEVIGNRVYDAALSDKPRFIEGGHLNMKLVLERFVVVFDDLYGDKNERFLEEIGRKYFMLYLKPIINGKGNCYVETETRNMKRTDLIVDYGGEQFIVEMKIWSGPKYHERGEQQIAEYLDYYHLKKGYMLTFNFNVNKEIGVKEVRIDDRILIEAFV